MKEDTVDPIDLIESRIAELETNIKELSSDPDRVKLNARNIEAKESLLVINRRLLGRLYHSHVYRHRAPSLIQ